MANSTAVISLHLGSKRACHPGGGRLGWIWNSWTIIKTRGVSVTIGVEAGGGRLGWRWNSWTIIKTRRVSRSKTPSEVSGISRGGGNAWPFSRHAEVETRSFHFHIAFTRVWAPAKRLPDKANCGESIGMTSIPNFC